MRIVLRETGDVQVWIAAKNLRFRVNNGVFQYRVLGDEVWQNLANFLEYQGDMTALKEAAEQAAQTATTKASEASASATSASDSATSANNALSQISTIGYQGGYNPVTNTPALSSIPNVGLADGAWYEISAPGTIGFATNYASGQIVNVGDILRKKGAAWELRLLAQNTSKIASWVAQSYLAGSQVNYINQDWIAIEDVTNLEIPSVSGKWISRLKYTESLYSKTTIETSYHGYPSANTLVGNSAWGNKVASTKAGVIKNIKLASYTTGSATATIFIIAADYKIKSKSTVTVLQSITDVASSNIAVAIGDYVAIYFNTITSNLKYNSSGGAGLFDFVPSSNVGDTIALKPSVATFLIDFSYSVNYVEYAEKKAEKADLDTTTQKIDNLISSTTKKEKGLETTYGLTTGSSALLGSFAVPYKLNPNKKYVITKFELPLATWDFVANPLPIKICVFSYTVNENGEPDSLTVVSVSDYLMISKSLQLNIEISGNKTFGMFHSNNANYPSLAKYTQNDGAYSFILTDGTNQPTVGKVYTNRLTAFKIETSQKFTLAELNEYTLASRIDKLETKTLTVNNSDSIMLKGSSLTEGLWSPYGFSWVEKINDILDMPVINAGSGGKNRAYNIKEVGNNLAIKNTPSNITHRQVRPTWIMWMNSANSSAMGIIGLNELDIAKFVTEELGSEMLVGAEEPWDAGAEELAKSYAELRNIQCSAITSIIRRCYPNANYAGTIRFSHRGWRAINPYLAILDLLEGLPLKRTIKMYRVRPKFTVNTINDLAYDNSRQRLYKYSAICAGSAHEPADSRYIDFRSADNIEAGGNVYDIPNTDTILSTNQNEIAAMLASESVSFLNYALIESILDIKNLSALKVTFNCSVNPEKVYIAKYKFRNIDDTNLKYTNTEFIEVDFSYNLGIVSFDLQELDGVLCLDRVKILVKKSGDFNISTPVINYAGVEKKNTLKLQKNRKWGAYVFNDTSFNGVNWLLNGAGASIKSFPAGMKQYTSYNTTEAFLSLADNTSYATRTVSVTPKSKYAIRIVAQNFFKFMTTRFGSSYPDFVVSDRVLLAKNEYDYGKLVVTINDKYAYDFLVGSGWQEIYFELSTEDETSINIKLQRQNETGIYSSGDTPIFIHDVSIQKLN